MVHFHNVDFSPKPLVISKTNKILLSGNVSISDELPYDASLHLIINKTVVFDDTKFEVTLPCIKGMGSCKLPLCDIWTLWYNDLVCPFFTKYGRPCSCPVEKGTFVADKVEVEVPFDKIKGTIGQFASVNPSSTLKYSQKSANQNFSSKG